MWTLDGVLSDSQMLSRLQSVPKRGNVTDWRCFGLTLHTVFYWAKCKTMEHPLHFRKDLDYIVVASCQGHFVLQYPLLQEPWTKDEVYNNNYILPLNMSKAGLNCLLKQFKPAVTPKFRVLKAVFPHCHTTYYCLALCDRSCVTFSQIWSRFCFLIWETFCLYFFPPTVWK